MGFDRGRTVCLWLKRGRAEEIAKVRRGAFGGMVVGCISEDIGWGRTRIWEKGFGVVIIVHGG